jgi:REP element-mobilizing transposase RayT
MSGRTPDPRRKRLRAEGYDYAAHGLYYVTIRCDRQEERFGAVLEGCVHLNEAGQMVEDFWTGIPDRFSSVELDAFIVMPNHLHGILFINHDRNPSPPSLGTIIQAFKSESTVHYGRGVKAGRFPPYDRALWQRGYHDRILRDDRMLARAQEYIEANPGRWEENRGSGIGKRQA